MLARKFLNNFSIYPELSICLQCRRFKHRQLVSKMFPSVDASLYQVKDTAKRVTSVKTKISSHESSDSAGSISQTLMVHHKLLLGASAGTFYFLPALTRALEKLYCIIDGGMQSIGAQKIAMPCLAPQNIWLATNRWDLMGSELFTVTDRNDAKHCLSPTHEEAVTSIVAAESPISYKRLPLRLYQFGYRHDWAGCVALCYDDFSKKSKLSNVELDLYTFDESNEKAEETFEEVCQAYSDILTRLGLPHVTVDASSGMMGGKKSKEFQLVSPVGEDILFQCDRCGKGVNKELFDDKNQKDLCCDQPNCTGSYQEKTGIEIAHAFVLGTLYSDTFGATFVDHQQKKSSLVMGCYGIGVTRLLAASIEVLSTRDRLRWSPLLAPHQIVVIPQKEGFKSDLTRELADRLYDQLSGLPNLRSEVVIDDRLQLSIGQRVNQAKNAGFPIIVVLGKRALEEDPVLEVINTHEDSTQHLGISQLVQLASQIETIVI